MEKRVRASVRHTACLHDKGRGKALFYITVILIANIIIAEANAIAGAHFGRALFESALATASVFAIDGIFAFLIRRLPERYFNADRSIFGNGL